MCVSLLLRSIWGQHENWVFCSCKTSIMTFFRKYDNIFILRMLDFTFRIFWFFWKCWNMCVLVFYYGVFWGQHETWVFCSCKTSSLTFFRNKDIWFILKVLDFTFRIFEKFWKNRNLCVLVFYYGLFWGNHKKIKYFSRVTLQFGHFFRK